LPRANDSGELIALNRASQNFHRGLASPPTTSKQFEQYLENCKRDDFEGLLVRRKSDRAILGVINLSQIFYGKFKSAYLGFYLGATFAGQGYMTEAIGLALKSCLLKVKIASYRSEYSAEQHEIDSASETRWL